MMEIDYLLGLELSKNIAITIGVISFILMTLLYLFNTNNTFENFSIFLDKILRVIFLFTSISIGLSIASFLIIYPTLNLGFQKFFTLAFYTKEISQGTLSLRVTSILLAFNFLKSAYNLINEKNFENHRKLTADYPDLQRMQPLMKYTSIDLLILSQNLIYGTITLLLWVFIFLSKSLLELHLVIWALFFIIDDWAIISDNLIALKGRILRWHKIRILLFNGLLYYFILSACSQQFSNLYLFLIHAFLTLLVIINATLFLGEFDG